MRAIEFDEFGGPEVLAEVERPDPAPEDGEVLVEVEAAGVNFADILTVAGQYAPPESLPHVPGMEVVGRTGDGRRVLGYLTAGGYASKAAVPVRDLVEVPEGVGAGEAAALLVQGLTAWHLLRSAARVGAGETVVVNAAAGGVGSLAVQLAKRLGAGRVIATASTEDKRALALELGADAAVDGAADGYRERVLDANEGRGVDVVLDAIGGAVLDQALDALASFGRVITYGASAGTGVPTVDPGRLTMHSTLLGGLWLAPLLKESGAAGEPLRELLRLAAAGQIRPQVGAEYPLSAAAQAHTDLLARRTTGKLILTVEPRDRD
ncbi:quinone oxidoreductase family protein [Actinomadura roseirufa]|uniref:quinone oxidoreductase family protein n=1 Tax=Actinomadura roseirufa TaxID=2094049 RepID=UPI00104142CB|nr:zinc-binding dehydrogenase [Actinomadura roseirufa]